MNKFNFIAIDQNKKKHKGTIEASSIDELKDILKEHNYILKTAKKVKSKNFQIDFLEEVKIEDLIDFTDKLIMLIKTGISIETALDLCKKNIKKNKFKKIIDSLKNKLDKGISLSDSMLLYPKVFPKFYINIIKVAELTGKFEEMLSYLSSFYKKETDFKKRMFSSLVYPFFLLLMSICVIAILSVIVIPNFIDIFNSLALDLPLITKIVLSCTTNIKKYGFLIILIILVVLILLVPFRNRNNFRFFIDKLKTKFPIYSKIYRYKISACFTNIFNIFYVTGIPTIVCFDSAISLIGNSYLSEKLKFSSDELRRGQTISSSLETINYFPPMMINLLAISEESNNLKNTLDNLNRSMEDEMWSLLQRKIKLIEPLSIIFIAFVVFFVIIAIFIPLFTMMNNIGAF